MGARVCGVAVAECEQNDEISKVWPRGGRRVLTLIDSCNPMTHESQDKGAAGSREKKASREQKSRELSVPIAAGMVGA